jgi:hypothetical protein
VRGIGVFGSAGYGFNGRAFKLFSWNLKDERGRQVSPGMYSATVTFEKSSVDVIRETMLFVVTE